MFDLDETLLSSILVVAKPIAAAIQATVNCKRVGVMVAGLEVPHAHLHLVPITATSQLSFEFAMPANPEELQVLSSRIRAQMDAH